MTFGLPEKFRYQIYKITGYSDSYMLNQLNKLGAEGWEVVSYDINTKEILLKQKYYENPSKSN